MSNNKDNKLNQKSTSAPAIIAILLAACMWGSIGIFIRYFTDLEYSPLTIVFARMSISFVITFVVILIFKRDLLRIKLKDLWCFIGTGFTSAIALNLFFSMSVVMNSLSLAAILLATAPLFVVLIAAPLFKEKITPVKLQALVIALIGCVLTSGIIGQNTSFSLPGIMIGVAAGVGYALYSIFTKAALNKGYDSLTVNVYSFGIGSIFCIPFTNFGVISNSFAIVGNILLIMLILHALFGALLPYLLYTYGLKYIDAGKASILVSCEPVAATIFGIFLYSEIPGPISVIGIAIVLFALVLLNLPEGFHTFLPGRKTDPASDCQEPTEQNPPQNQ